MKSCHIQDHQPVQKKRQLYLELCCNYVLVSEKFSNGQIMDRMINKK